MVAGNICVVKSAVIPNSLPLNLNLERAYPPVDAKTTPVNVTSNEIKMEFLTQCKKSVLVNNVR